MTVTDTMHAYIRGINGVSFEVIGKLLRASNLGSMLEVDRILNMQGSAWHISDPTANVKDDLHKIWDMRSI